MPFTLVIPDAVIADVPTGFVVDQVRVTLQLLEPADIVQDAVSGVILPDITGHADVVNDELEEYPVPVAFVA